MPHPGARLSVAAACCVLALIVCVIALAYLGQAVFLLLEASALRPSAAAAITGAGGLVLAVLIGLFGRHLFRPAVAPRTAARANGVANDIAADLGALAAQSIVGATREHPYGTMGAALAAGVAVGAIPELRKMLGGLLKQ